MNDLTTQLQISMTKSRVEMRDHFFAVKSLLLGTSVTALSLNNWSSLSSIPKRGNCSYYYSLLNGHLHSLHESEDQIIAQ